MDVETLLSRITANAEIFGGKPIIRGMMERSRHLAQRHVPATQVGHHLELQARVHVDVLEVEGIELNAFEETGVKVFDHPFGHVVFGTAGHNDASRPGPRMRFALILG